VLGVLSLRRSSQEQVSDQEVQDQAKRWNITVQKAPIGWWADVDDTWCQHLGSCLWGRDKDSAELKAQRWLTKRLEGSSS
jgi:hypothetical protein